MKKSKFTDSQILSILKQAENSRLKMYAEERLKAEILKEAIEKKW
jgi:putative transposase